MLKKGLLMVPIYNMRLVVGFRGSICSGVGAFSSINILVDKDVIL